MLLNRICASWLVLSTALIVGCGGSGSAPPSPPPSTMPTLVDDKAQLKSIFQAIAESGQAGSALAGVRDGMQKLNDPSLMKLLDSLEKASGEPEQVKQFAKQIVDKLGS